MKPHRWTADTPVRTAGGSAVAGDKPRGSAGAGATSRRKRPKVEPTAAQIKALAEKIAKQYPPLVSAEENRDHKRLTRRGEVEDHPIAAHWRRGPMIPRDASWKRRKRPS
jgi:hypothetical protein